eukprot:7254092-Pyramimonas_sp.AAC.1
MRSRSSGDQKKSSPPQKMEETGLFAVGVNQYRIRQAAYELVAFFDTFNVSPTHHKADTWASCEAQLYALW